MAASIVTAPTRLSQRLRTFAASIALVVAVGGSGYGMVEGAQWLGTNPTVPVTSSVHLNGVHLSQQIDLRRAENVLAGKFGSNLPDATHAQAALQDSHQFGPVGVVTSGHDAVRDMQNEIDVKQSDNGGLVLYAPNRSDVVGGMELYLSASGPARWQLAKEATPGAILALVFGAIFGGIGLLLGAGFGALTIADGHRRLRSKQSWKALVTSRSLGPAEPKDGFTVLVADKEIDTNGGSKTIRFVARRYRFYDSDKGNGEWRLNSTERIPGYDECWTDESDHVQMVERWVEFCHAVSERNQESWKQTVMSSYPKERHHELLPALSAHTAIEDLLPDPSKVVSS